MQNNDPRKMKADEVAAFSVYEGDLEMLLSYGLDQLFGGAAIVELNSGFSFTDIGADRTGVRFAELAVSSDENARKVQRIMGIGVKEDDFMAEFRDLPESMAGEVLERIYAGVGESAYNTVIEDIENRISSVILFN